MGQREEDKNSCSVLFEKVCLQTPEWTGQTDVPLSVELEILGSQSICQIL